MNFQKSPAEAGGYYYWKVFPYAYFGPEFPNILKSCGAIISGSSVLYALLKFHQVAFPERSWEKSMDMDIYVNVKNAKPIFEFLERNICGNYSVYSSHTNTQYSKSFLEKNRIARIITFTSEYDKKFDLVLVHNNQSLDKVVSNFDLSCCMNYFNFSDMCIYSKCLEMTLSKKAFLSSEYANAFYKGNKVTYGRFTKYTQRGFQINLPPVPIDFQDYFYVDNNQVAKTKNQTPKYKILDSLIFGCIFMTDYIKIKHKNLYISLQNSILKNTDFYAFTIESNRFGGQFLVSKINYLFLDPEEFVCRKDYEKIGMQNMHRLVCETLKEYLYHTSEKDHNWLKDWKFGLYKELDLYVKFKF